MWFNLFGRDWVVKRRKPTLLGIIGTTLFGMGVGGLAWGSVGDIEPDRIGIASVVLGAVLICYKRLETKNLAADEIYKLAHNRGVEEGYEEGYKDRGQEQPIRPVLVPLHRCPNCDTAGALTPVGSVADRV